MKAAQTKRGKWLFKNEKRGRLILRLLRSKHNFENKPIKTPWGEIKRG